MVDPFFQNNVQNNPQWSNQNPSTQNNVSTDNVWSSDQNNINAQIQQITQQQEEIQKKHQQLKELYDDKSLSADQKSQVVEQLQKLVQLYNQNKQALATLTTNISGQKEIHVNKNIQVKQNKHRRKVSFKWLLIGCAVLFVFLVWWLAAVFYYLIQNPNQLSSVGINPSTAIQLLQTFATIFFGLLFFASLWLLITNFYRLIVSKNKKKIWYVLGIIVGFIILVATLIFGARTLNTLKDIQVDDFVDTNRLLKPYIQLKDNTAYIWSDTSLVTIAPANMFFTLSTDIFNKQIVPQLWDITIQNITLDCGNGQDLNMDLQNATFQWACLYQNKWNYPLKLLVKYINNQTSEQLDTEIPSGELPINSQIDIRSNQWDIIFSKNEIIVWQNPVKVTYDASDVFKDFQLPDYNIIWDADGDGVADKSDITTYTHLYTWAKLYYVNMRFPWLNNYLYSFPLRVEQSDVPVADIQYTQISENQYNINASFLDTNPDISEYLFNIIDKKSNQQIDSIVSETPSINYTFPGNGTYAVQMIFVTQEWKQGSAESQNIVIWWSEFQISYDIYIKTPTTPQFEKMQNTSEIKLKEIPTIIKIDITNIVPSSPTLQKKVYIDWSPIISTNDSFQTTIDENKDYNLQISVSDPNRDTSTQQDIKISVDRDDIIWNLLVSPDTVWVSPFTVKFDASTTTINDPQDEIVYFSRDYWDGEAQNNISQSIVSHTYNYDFDSENGTFYPKVVIKTKKWRELTIWSGTMILVKKPTVSLSINIDSHPAQVANIWDKVDFSLDIDWLPETILRNFANWNTLECNGRECVDSSQIYDTPWEYNISAEVSYTDKPSVKWNITLVVQ